MHKVSENLKQLKRPSAISTNTFDDDDDSKKGAEIIHKPASSRPISFIPSQTIQLLISVYCLLWLKANNIRLLYDYVSKNAPKIWGGGPFDSIYAARDWKTRKLNTGDIVAICHVKMKKFHVISFVGGYNQELRNELSTLAKKDGRIWQTHFLFLLHSIVVGSLHVFSDFFLEISDRRPIDVFILLFFQICFVYALAPQFSSSPQRESRLDIRTSQL